MPFIPLPQPIFDTWSHLARRTKFGISAGVVAIAALLAWLIVNAFPPKPTTSIYTVRVVIEQALRHPQAWNGRLVSIRGMLENLNDISNMPSGTWWLLPPSSYDGAHAIILSTSPWSPSLSGTTVIVQARIHRSSVCNYPFLRPRTPHCVEADVLHMWR